MALSDHITPRIVVPLVGDNSVAVRGLNLDDFAILLAENMEAISKAASLYQAQREDIFSNKNLQDFIITVAKDFPGLLSEVISIAADEPGSKVKLPITLQMSVLSAITKLTLEDAGGLGNLFASLAALGKGVLQTASEVSPKPSPSRGSIGD